MSSSFVSKHLVSVSILVVVTIQLVSIQNGMSLNQTNAYLHHKYIKNQGIYKPESPYEKNIKEVMKVISKYLDVGYVQASTGDPQDAVMPMIQCGADSSESMCCSCLATTFSGIRRRCPYSKGSIIWYDQCVLKISSIYDYGEIDYENYFYLYNPKEVKGDTDLFNKKTRDFLYKLKEKAIKENSCIEKNYLYATGHKSFMLMKLYAMTQCTGDLSFKNYSICLDWIMSQFPKCCNGKQGGRVLSTSCNFRYELYPFVNPVK